MRRGVGLLTVLALPHGVLAATSVGSGFFISSDGYFLTCLHVVEGARRIELKSAGGLVSTATLVAADRTIDLAILKASGQFFPLPI